MSGTASTSVVTVGVGGGELGYGGYRAPFTPVQWQELEHQAMIYKYLLAGLPVPPDLVMPIRRSFDAISSRFFNHPSLGYCSYYGKKFDPEPGRCRRTDGKKWRCSKDAHPDSKYCERHMHRGRNRSRKPVESQTTTQSLSTAATNIATIATGGGNNTVSFQSGGSGSFQNMPLYSAVSTEGSSFGGSMMQMEPMMYGINNNREFSFSHGDSGNVESLGLGTGTGSGAWCLMPSQVSSTSLLDQKSDSRLLGHSSSQQHVAIVDKQQHCFFRSEIGSPGSVKRQEQHAVHPFFSEWPSTKESWSNLEDDGSNKNIFSSTQLSISTPRTSSDFLSRSAYSPNDG